MAVVLLRVDERLIHGQVTVGWGRRLKATRYFVVDDALADQEWEQELYSLGAPAGAETEFLAVDAALERLPDIAATAESVIVLTRDLDHMVRLAAGDVLEGAGVNLGGIHSREDREQVLPYLFLSEADRDRIRELEAEGFVVTAQELPGSPRTPARALVGA